MSITSYPAALIRSLNRSQIHHMSLAALPDLVPLRQQPVNDPTPSKALQLALFAMFGSDRPRGECERESCLVDDGEADTGCAA
jgi:hypothetical protein